MKRMTEEEWAARKPWLHKGQADRHTQDRCAKELNRARAREERLEAALMHVFTRVALSPSTQELVRTALEAE